jgi:hypothetical protein
MQSYCNTSRFKLTAGAQTLPRKTMQGECRSHARMAMVKPQGFL